jgi:hypothetical protein
MSMETKIFTKSLKSDQNGEIDSKWLFLMVKTNFTSLTEYTFQVMFSNATEFF